MKKIITLYILLFSMLLADNINVSIINIDKDKKGQIVVGLFKDAQNFTKTDKTYKQIVIKTIVSSAISFNFKNIPEGEYAIAIFHDENSNLKLDTNIFGIPKEGYGFSNNIRHTLRAAYFKEAKFYLNSSKKILIKMGY